MAPRNMTFIPRADDEFQTWQENFYNPAADLLAAHPGTDELIEALYTMHDQWYVHYSQAKQWAATLQSQIVRKNETRAAYEKIIRTATRLIQTYPETTDADRATLGITVRPSSSTRRGGGSNNDRALTSRPLVRIESANRLMHTIRFSDESTPTRTAKPRRALGAEVRVGLIDPHAQSIPGPDALRFLTLSTSGTAETDFPLEAAGKTAVYALRWVGADGVVGPWSESVTATVAA